MANRVVRTENQTQHLPKEDGKHDRYATLASHSTTATSSNMNIQVEQLYLYIITCHSPEAGWHAQKIHIRSLNTRLMIW